MKLFLDESGNSGVDIYEAKQPILAYSGVWLDEPNEQHFLAYLGGLRKEHRLQGKGELKGKKFLKTDAGRVAIGAVIRELHARKVPLSLLAVHKPFMAAAVLIEDCTDYVYNPAFSERWTWDSELKEPLVETILAAADERLLINAWRARSGLDKASFKAAYGSLLFALAVSPNAQLADVASKMRRTDLDDLWESERSSREDRGSGYSPNLSAFGSLMQLCERQAEQLGLHEVAIVHDVQDEYQEIFTKWWAASRTAQPFEFRDPGGNDVKLPLQRLSSLTFDDSTGDVGIQLADLVASALRVVVQERTTGIGSRGAGFIADIRAHVAARDRMGDFPFVIGPKRWQYDMMDLLGMMALLRAGALG